MAPAGEEAEAAEGERGGWGALAVVAAAPSIRDCQTSFASGGGDGGGDGGGGGDVVLMVMVVQVEVEVGVTVVVGMVMVTALVVGDRWV